MAAYAVDYAYEYWVITPEATSGELERVDRIVTEADMQKLKIHLLDYLAYHRECDPLNRVDEHDIYMMDEGFESLKDAQEAFAIVDKAVVFILENY